MYRYTLISSIEVNDTIWYYKKDVYYFTFQKYCYKLIALFSPVRVLHIPQRNYTWKIQGVKLFQRNCNIAWNKGQNLQHIRVLQDGVQMLDNRLYLPFRECGEHRLERNGCKRRSQPNTWPCRVACRVHNVVAGDGSGHIHGVNDEVIRDATTMNSSVVSVVAFVGVAVVVVSFIRTQVCVPSGGRRGS